MCSSDLDKINGDCNIVKGPITYNPSSRKWIRAEKLHAGNGYFVKAESECTLGMEEDLPPAVE